MNRRKFVLNCAAAAVTQTGHLLARSRSVSAQTVNLVPDSPGEAPNYWCTWAVQNYMYGQKLKELNPELLEGDSGSQLAHEAMNEEVLLGKNGWAHHFFPDVRQDLYLMLDDGWESGGTATFELDRGKFPSYTGSPSNRLLGVNKAIQKQGWRSAALWCRNTPGGSEDHRLETISAEADIPYWKVDIGDPNFHLTEIRNATRSALKFEHVHGESPLNGSWQHDGRFGVQARGSKRQGILTRTDVYRTYDVTSILSLPTTLDRLSEMLKGSQAQPDVHSLLNVEDEVYVAAVMGCTMGVMRHPLTGLRPGTDTDLFFNGSRRAKLRMDEVVRALRWQRIAPPFGAGTGTVTVSEEVLTDNWTFERGQTWLKDVVGKTAYQGAPASIARNISLPKVDAEGERPFVFAARFPNGAVAVGVQERTHSRQAWYMPPASVELNVGDAPGPYGIFGCCKSLCLVFDRPITRRSILVQDLMADVAHDVTDQIHVDGNKLVLTESQLRSFGLSGASKGDLSSPGVVLALR